MGKDYIKVNKDGTGELFIFSRHSRQEDNLKSIFSGYPNDKPTDIKFVIDVKAFIKEKFRK